MSIIDKRQRKPKGQLQINNPDTLATLDAHDSGQRQTKHKYTTPKTKTMSNGPHWKS
jgi:hypothetical protein